MNDRYLTELERKTLADFKKKVGQALGSKVIEYKLFGSRVRGDSSEESDLDLLVITTEIGPQIKNTIWDIANELLLETDINISPLVMSQKEFQSLLTRERGIALDIQREGISI